MGNENQKHSSETPLLEQMGGFTIETLSKLKSSASEASSRCFELAMFQVRFSGVTLS